MTAAHVVQLADAVSVQMPSGFTTSATILSSVVMADLALIKLDNLPEDLVVAKMGDSDKMEIGDEVFVVGSPYEVEYTLTVGHVSGRREAEGFSNELVPVEFLQTDAAINRGNSGGPMFNMDGQVVGIVSHIISESGGYEGLGFAVAINSAKELLLNQNAFWSGVEFFSLSQDLAKAFNLPQQYGLLVQRVAVDSLGQKLGLQPGKIPVKIGEQTFMIGGDIILEIQDIKLLDDLETAEKIRKSTTRLPKGKKLKIKVLRGGEIVTLGAIK
jgi:S1-C subfamily serine protease